MMMDYDLLANLKGASLLRTLLTSDLHRSDNPRDAYRADFMRKTLPRLITENKIEQLFILGDLTEEKDRHSAALVNQIVDELVHLSHLCGRVVLLRGNHDYESDVDNPFFQFLRNIPGIDWINDPIQIGDWLFLPHTRNHQKDWSNFSMGAYSRIFAHNTFNGAKGENGRDLGGIPLDVFPKKAAVYSGDVHVPQLVGPVLYVGAPYTIDFGDDFRPRVILFDRNSEDEEISVDGPQKRLIDATTVKEFHKFGIRNTFKGDIVKVRMHIGMEDCARWWEMKEAIRDWGGKHGRIIHTISPIVEYRETDKMQAAQERAPKSDKALLGQYGDARAIDENTMKMGHHLIGPEE